MAWKLVESQLREGLLSAGTALKVGTGMVAKQMADTVARVGEGALDIAQVRGAQALGKTIPRTTTVPGFRELFHTIKYAKDEGLPGLKNILKGQDSTIMPGHSGPTGNPFLDFALTPISKTLGAKEQILRTFAYGSKQYDVARTLAENDRLDGLVSREEVPQRAQDYLDGKSGIEGARNKKLADSFGIQAANYETRSKQIIKTREPFRSEELQTSPTELINSLSRQYADKQVYAGPSRVQEFVKRAFGGSEAGKLTEATLVPFVKRPSNSIIDLLYTYTGVRAPSEAFQAAFRKSLGPAERASLNQALVRGGAGYAVMALGAILNKAGVMTSGDDGKSRNVKQAAGYQPGAIHIGGRYYKVGNIPFIGWLLTAGATAREKGLKAVPGAVGNAILDHPLIRLAESAGNAIDVVKGRKSIGKVAEQSAGSTAARFVPTIPRVVAESTDTKQRDIEGLTGPTRERLPYFRNQLPVKKDVFQNEMNKPRLSAFDPYKSTADRSTPGTKEMIKLGLDINNLKEETKRNGVTFRLPQSAINKANPAALKAIDRYVQSPRYKSLSDEQKRDEIKKTIHESRAPFEQMRRPAISLRPR